MRLPIIRWFFSLPASVFYCLTTLAMHDTLGSPGGVHGFPSLFAQFLLPGSVALWVLAGARRRGHSLHYDAGSFIYFAWPILAPIYVFSTRGWSAFATLGWFLLLYLAAEALGTIPYFYFVMRQ